MYMYVSIKCHQTVSFPQYNSSTVVLILFNSTVVKLYYIDSRTKIINVTINDAPILGSAYQISVYRHAFTHIAIGFFSTNTIDIELCMCELINCHVLIDGRFCLYVDHCVSFTMWLVCENVKEYITSLGLFHSHRRFKICHLQFVWRTHFSWRQNYKDL